MGLSKFEKLVMEAFIKEDPEAELLRVQMISATVSNREYTGVGLFTEIQVPENAPLLRASNRYIEGVPKAHLEHPELSNGAGVLLWFENGRISTLECYTYGGEWPDDETLFTIST